MKTNLLCYLGIFILFSFQVKAQLSNAPGPNGIQTYVNPILPGDHPDQTLLRMGKNFYSTGSNFHFTPYLPILHSTDLMHWEVIARVIPPTSSIPNNDTPAGGTWEGALAFFNNTYWVYFSNNAGGGQYFCKASNPAGPWSAPVKVNGVYGYDNSIFVDDDGTPYMLMKNGQDNNGIQKLGMDGQPSGAALNLNWVNSNGHPYSWAEGPVMCKRNGRYYYFVAGNVTGGQYVLSTATLTANESSWTRHGNFWQTASSPGGFTGPNHITQPVMLDDGTWWCLSHAYDNGGWEGQGRQSHLHQVVWDANGVPKGIPVNTNPVAGPNLPSSGISYEFIKSDYFSSATLSLNWHFFNKTMASTSRYSLSERPGYLRLKPGNTTTHILQKDKGKYYSLTTQIDFNATANGQEAGLKLTSGNDQLFYNLYSGYNNGKKIGVFFNGSRTEISNGIGNVLWLRVERALHIVTSYYSADGITWTKITSTDVSALDQSQPNYNQWVGTSVGMYASNASADFDLFSYRYGFAPLRAEGRNNWYGVTFANKTPGRTVTNSASGDWLMMAGVDLGSGNAATGGIEVNVASSTSNASLEVWLDNISGNGTKVATIAIPNTGGTDSWNNVNAAFNASGQHDVYLRFIGNSNAFFVNTIRFTPKTTTVTQSPYNGTPASIPGKIEAENYDLGGQGIAFNETTASNSGNTFRTDDVDVEATGDTGGGYDVGWIAAGEWLEYTVNVTSSGIYNLEARVASPNTGGALHIEMDGVNISGTITVPNIGDWQTYQSLTIPNINLTAGQKVMRISMDASWFNINYVSFTPVNTRPTVSITSPANNSTFTAPASITLNANASDADGTVSNVQFFNGSTLLGSDATAPYSFTWTNVSAGTYTLTAKATDNAGTTTTSSPITITVNTPPSTTTLQGETACSVDGILNETTNGGFNGTGYVNTDNAAGNGVTWAINSSTTQTISLNIRYANASATSRNMSLSVNESVQLASVNFPSTGSWTSWNTSTIQVTLASGNNLIQLTALTDEGGPNIDELTFSASNISQGNCNPQSPFNESPAVIPGTIQAEEYDLGGEGLAFHETTSGNSGNVFRTDDVDIETTADAGGGYNVGWIANGEWLEYTVNVTTTGTYNMELRVATTSSDRTLQVEIDGENISGSVTLPNTGGWQTWQTVTIPNINLTAGQKVMRVTWTTDWQNLNYISFTPASASALKTGILEVQSGIAPNPTENTFTLTVQESVQSVTIMNDQGVIVYTGGSLTEGESIGFGEQLSSGLYMVIIQYTSGRKETRKVQKL